MYTQEYKTKNLITDIWIYLKPYKWRFFFASISRLIGDIAWLYPAYALAFIVDFFTKYTPGDSLKAVYIVLLIYLSSVIVRCLGSYYSRIIGFNIANKVYNDSTISILRHMFLVDMAWHEKENSGNKMKRMDKGSAGLEKILRMWLVNFIEIGIGFIGVIIILGKFDSKISLAIVIFIVTFYLLSRIFRKRAVEISKLANIQDEHVHGIIFESINHIRSVKVMSMGNNILSRIRTESDDLMAKIKQRMFWFQTGGSVTFFYAQIFFIMLSIYIIWGITQNIYEISFFVLFHVYFHKVWGAIQEFTEVSDQYAISKYDVYRMQSLLKIPITIDVEKSKNLFPSSWQNIVISNLSFSYGEKKVLDNISFEINKGQKIGIIGLSGAGKSTLFKLLLKENESYEGEIKIGNIELKNISKNEYLKNTAVVLQETELFNISLKDNIIVSGGESVLNLPRAIEIAHVQDFMDKLPKGVDTIVGEKGVKLSGGEKQRVGIARAVFKAPQILLMDEATSHLDIESEKKIQDSLHEFFKEVTAIVIAHRLTTIKEMDVIILIENGKIIEKGSFDELYKNKKGRFHELWEKQKL